MTYDRDMTNNENNSLTVGQSVRVTGNSRGNPEGEHCITVGSVAKVVRVEDDVVLVFGDWDGKPELSPVHQGVLPSDLEPVK
jgi:hypothetical protein